MEHDRSLIWMSYIHFSFRESLSRFYCRDAFVPKQHLRRNKFVGDHSRVVHSINEKGRDQGSFHYFSTLRIVSWKIRLSRILSDGHGRHLRSSHRPVRYPRLYRVQMATPFDAVSQAPSLLIGLLVDNVCRLGRPGSQKPSGVP